MSKLQIKSFTSISPEELEKDLNNFIDSDPEIDVIDINFMPRNNTGDFNAFAVYYKYDEDFYY